jgi:hypothetical protein
MAYEEGLEPSVPSSEGAGLCHRSGIAVAVERGRSRKPLPLLRGTEGSNPCQPPPRKRLRSAGLRESDNLALKGTRLPHRRCQYDAINHKKF